MNHVAVEGPGLIQNFLIGIQLSACDYCQMALATSAHNLLGLFGDGNYLTLGSNVVVANSTIGIDLQSASNCQIQSNDVSGNGGIGILLTNGVGNTVNNNTANGNAATGIVVGASTSAARVYSNVTNGNGGAGIAVGSPASGIQVFNNSSSVGNGTFDLQDGNALCGSDLWNNNVFFTRSQACIH